MSWTHNLQTHLNDRPSRGTASLIFIKTIQDGRENNNCNYHVLVKWTMLSILTREEASIATAVIISKIDGKYWKGTIYT